MEMITFIYLNSFQTFSQEKFITQLEIYNRISEVYLVDNSLSEEERNRFLEKLSGIELEHVRYLINDSDQSFGMAADQLLFGAGTEILFAAPQVIIGEEDILEMKRIYGLSEHYKFVVPRTNDGHYQTVPLTKYLFCNEDVLPSREACKEMSSSLPECSILPWAEDGCVLMDGTCLFDIRAFMPDYASMSAALKDFSVFMSDYGYQTVAANHAFAERVIEKNGARKKAELEFKANKETNIKTNKETNPEAVKNSYQRADGITSKEAVEDPYIADQKKLLLRHRDALGMLKQKYLQCFLTPQDYFLELIGKRPSEKKKILYYIPHLSPAYNGSAVHALLLLDGLLRNCPENWEFSAVMPEKARIFFGVEKKYNLKWMEIEEIRETYDLAFAPYHIFSPRQLDALKKYTLKIVCWPLDLINDRCNYLCGPHHIKFHEELARICDGLVFSSESVRKDYEQFFCQIENVQKMPKLVSHIVPEPLAEEECTEPLPFSDFYLIFGNQYRHKMIEPILGRIRKMKDNFILIGAPRQEQLAPNIYAYPSGQLSDEMIASLYRRCRALIFPSIYEGFGLPVLQALNAGKNVYLMESELNRELEHLSDGFSGHMFFMKSLYELSDLLAKTKGISGPDEKLYSRTWDDVARECIRFLKDVLNRENDYDKIASRWRMAFRTENLF